MALTEDVDSFGFPLDEVRTKLIKVNGQEHEAVLMAGGPGFKIYSIPDAVVVMAGRKSIVAKESDPEYKPIMKYVNLRYQPASEQDAIKQAFDNLLHTKIEMVSFCGNDENMFQ